MKLKDIRQYNIIKKRSKYACKGTYNGCITNSIIPYSTSNPKRFWGLFKSKNNYNNEVAPLKAKTGSTHLESATTANILNEHFSSVFNKTKDANTIPDMGPSPRPSANNINVTKKGVP